MATSYTGDYGELLDFIPGDQSGIDDAMIDVSKSSLPATGGGSSGNLDPDYVVDDRGRVVDTAGNVVSGPTNASTGSSGSFDFSKMFGNLFKGISGAGSKIGTFAQDNPLQALLMAAVLGKALTGGNTQSTGGYKGPGINMGLKATREALPQPAYQPYSGAATMGRQFFSPVTYAAEGGLMGLASGRYLRGDTDGMADKIPSSIDGQQPAKLSHGEFVIPADVVSHLGNGNSDAGANVLYKMMDRVRKARTGTTKQGHRISPEKFTPGGQAYADGGAVAFAEGGTPAGTTTETNLSSWAGPYVTDYLSKAKALSDMPYQPYQGPLSAGYSPLQQQAFQGLASLQMPSQYGMATDIYGQAAQRAGMMSYQPSYFGNQFQAPQQTQATQFDAGYQAPQIGAGTTQFTPQFQAPTAYTPQTATSGYQAPQAFTPGQFTSGFQAPQVGAGTTQFTSQFQAPQQYQAATDLTAGMGPQQYQGTQFQTGLGPVGSVQDYMNQYQQGVTDIAAREARRQAAIAGAGEKAQFAKAGAFGGARQAIAQAERERNLAQQIGDIQQKGLAGAFEAAQKQRLSEAGMGLEAQRALEQSRQYGAGLTQQGLGQLLQARQAQEASRQFGAQQGMQASQLQAQYGLSAQQAQEAARQFNAGQQMTAAQLQSQFGLDAQKAGEMSRQFAAQQAAQQAQTAAQLGLQAQQQTAQERQFGAQQGMQAAQLQAQYGLSAQQAQEAARQFNAGQQMTAAQLQSQFGMDAQKANEMARQFQQQQSMQAAQLGAQYGTEAQRMAEQSRQYGADFGLRALQQQMAAASGLGTIGGQQFGSQLEGLRAILGAGGTQRDIEQQGITALMNEYNKQMMWPYQQLQFAQSMMQGLPVSAASNVQNLTPLQKLYGAGADISGIYKLLSGG